MRKQSVSEEEIRRTEDYLKGYRTGEAMLSMEEYERSYFQRAAGAEEQADRVLSVFKLKQFEIRHFIMGMANSREKLMLYYHYVLGETVERCAELMGLSRSSGFRIKRRALVMATLHRKRDQGEILPMYDLCEDEFFKTP